MQLLMPSRPLNVPGAFARKHVGDARAMMTSRAARGHDRRRAEVARRARATTLSAWHYQLDKNTHHNSAAAC